MGKHEWIRLPDGRLELKREPDGLTNYGEYVVLEKTDDKTRTLIDMTGAIAELMKQAEKSMGLLEHHEYVSGSGQIIIKELQENPDKQYTVGIKYTMRDLEFKPEEQE